MNRHIIIFLFLGAFLAVGCHPLYNYQSSKITVYKIYDDEKDYSLLSVRGDTAITVLDWKERDSKPFPYSHVQVLRIDSIAWISRAARGAQPPTVGGFLVGAGVGFLLSIT